MTKNSAAYSEPAKLWNVSFIMMLVLSVFTGTASQMITPLVSKYAISLGATLTVAGAVASLMSIAALVMRPVSGIVADRVNRKYLMLAATCMTAACIAGTAFAKDVRALIVLRALHGVAFSFMTVSNMAFASTLIPRSRMGEGMGYLGLGAILASAVGPNLGLWLVGAYGYSACFLASAGVSCLSLVIMALIPYRQPPRDPEDSPAPVRRKFTLESIFAKELTIYVLLLALLSCGNGLLSAYIALIGDERGIANIGLYYTAYSIVVVFVRPFTGRLLDKRGLAIILYPSIIMAGVAMGLIGAATALWMIVLAGVINAVGTGAGSPSIQAVSVKMLGRSRAGVASSCCYIGMDIGNGVAPILGGIAATSFGYANTFYGYAVILVAAGLTLFTIQRRIDRRRELSPARVDHMLDK